MRLHELNETVEPDNIEMFNVWILAFIILHEPNETIEPDNIEMFNVWILAFVILHEPNKTVEPDNIEIFNVWNEPVVILLFLNDKFKLSKLTMLALLIDAFFVIEIFEHEQLYKIDTFQIVHGSIVSFW